MKWVALRAEAGWPNIDMFSKIIISARLVLRPYENGDISAWQKWDVDPAVQVFMPEFGNKPMTAWEELEYLKECEKELDGYYWSIVWKDNDTLVGTISITEVNDHGIGELGIVIGEKEYWRRGVAQEAIKMILKFSPDLGLRRIVAEFEEGNVAMEKVLIKTGFQKESAPLASRIKNNRPINTARYFILINSTPSF